MAQTLNFDVGTSKPEELKVTIAGRPFRFIAKPKGVQLGAVFSAASRNDGADSLKAIIDFLVGQVVAEERDAFRAFLEGDDVLLDVDDIVTIFNGLVEAYTARPTGPASGS